MPGCWGLLIEGLGIFSVLGWLVSATTTLQYEIYQMVISITNFIEPITNEI